jgi:hypothetical protein
MDETVVKKHHVCLGTCGITTSLGGACTMAGCSHEGEHLAECACEDDLHKEVKGDTPPIQEIQL